MAKTKQGIFWIATAFMHSKYLLESQMTDNADWLTYSVFNKDLSIYLFIASFCDAGDITDAKLEDREGSRQFEDEWKQYDRILQDTGIVDKTVWLDTRGNHGKCAVSLSFCVYNGEFLWYRHHSRWYCLAPHNSCYHWSVSSVPYTNIQTQLNLTVGPISMSQLPNKFMAILPRPLNM